MSIPDLKRTIVYFIKFLTLTGQISLMQHILIIAELKYFFSIFTKDG